MGRFDCSLIEFILCNSIIGEFNGSVQAVAEVGEIWHIQKGVIHLLNSLYLVISVNLELW